MRHVVPSRARTNRGDRHLASELPIRCSANVCFLFRDLPLLSGLEAAANAGFRSVELFDPFVVPPRELASALERLGLRVDMMNFPLGDSASGERGFAGDPGVARSSCVP